MASGSTVDTEEIARGRILLKLYVAGQNPRSERAKRSLERLVAESEQDFEVVVIDIVERPQLAEDEKILATPVVVRELPLPIRRIIGDLSDFESVLVGLDLREERSA